MPAPSWLILIKHSQPEIEPKLSAHEWQLTEEGRRRCGPLAEALRGYQLSLIFSSPEPKARETARLLAGRLDLPLEVHPQLHEHRRQTAAFTTSEQFEASVARLFAQPDRLIFGEESALQAEGRFSQAVAEILKLHGEQNLALVAHGTVISLFVAQACGLDGFSLWRQLGLPAWIALQVVRDSAGLITFQFEALENIATQET